MTTADEIMAAAGLARPVVTDKGRVLIKALSETIQEGHPCALTQENQVALYRDGVYDVSGIAFSAIVGELLGDHFKPGHRRAAEEFTAGQLYISGRLLPVHVGAPLLNCRNGMLDLSTGELLPHDPIYLSGVQIPVAWDPEATCPTYEEWLKATIPDQIEDLEETIATMLDPSRTPTKAMFAFGPARSGKSTMLRLMAAVAGSRNTSAVTLHQLTTDRFAAANVFGKILNSAADISAGHVEDLSIFKMMTGEDMINANRKYGGQFTFTNRALFAFSANEIPTVGETSRAYVERIKPFEFARSFAGKEDPAIEQAMLAELPGILVRWVNASRQMRSRGNRLPTLPSVAEEFATRSDRVQQWVSERCTVQADLDGQAVSTGAYLPAGYVSTKALLADQFRSWAGDNGGKGMTNRRIIDRLTSVNGVYEVRATPSGKRGLNIVQRPEWDQD